ncbi:hypothetical protein [Undibacterium sp. TJN19]|uniref:hypothetical protein n=1 Tax=Undibacterium sp. TJN19 TaxID=3413055 RepID=UPI003BF17ACB
MSTTPAAQSADDLSQVIPTVETAIVAGETLEIKHFKIGRLPLVLLAVQPISHMLMNRVPGERLDVPSMFVTYSADCLQLLAILANRSREWVDELDPDEAVELFGRLLEVNLDFFIAKVLPKMTGTATRLTQTVKGNVQAVQTLGQMASSYSSKAATTSTTS